MELRTFILLVVTGLALADHPGASYLPPRPVPVYGALQLPARYNFDWAVRDSYSGNDFGHQESRDGDYTQGSYYVLLPDGRTQRVNYRVDGDSGFVADVIYEGQARPYVAPARSQLIYSPPSQPTYTPPRPAYVPPQNAYGK